MLRHSTAENKKQDGPGSGYCDLNPLRFQLLPHLHRHVDQILSRRRFVLLARWRKQARRVAGLAVLQVMLQVLPWRKTYNVWDKNIFDAFFVVLEIELQIDTEPVQISFCYSSDVSAAGVSLILNNPGRKSGPERDRNRKSGSHCWRSFFTRLKQSRVTILWSATVSSADDDDVNFDQDWMQLLQQNKLAKRESNFAVLWNLKTSTYHHAEVIVT